MWQHDMEQFARRWRAFGWHAIVDRRPRHARDSRRARRSARDQGPADDDPGAHDQGQRRVVRRRARTAGTARRSRRARSSTARSPSSRSSSCRCPRRPASNLAAQIPKPASQAARRRHAEAGGAARLQARRSGRDARGLRHRARQARRRRPARRRARRRREELDVQRQVREGRARALLPELHRRAGDGRRGDGAGGARRDSVSVDVRLLPDARRRLRPHGGDQQRRHQAGRLARRRVDRRGRAVADGARGSGDVPRASRTSRCSIRATR